MENRFKANVSVTISASAGKVWQALTDPAMIKEYLFGTNTTSDWKKGSIITYQGVWEGKTYKDKGEIIDIQPEKLLHTTYYSPLSGKEDKPENYANVIYTLKPEGDNTSITISQDNLKDEAGVRHMEENWRKVLEGMKKLLEQ